MAISAGVDALTLAEFAASITTTSDTDVSASTDALILSTYAATILLLEDADQPTGGWGFYNDYQIELNRRRRETREQERREREAQEIQNETDRKIAIEQRRIEAAERREAELSRVGEFSQRYQSVTARKHLGERVAIAYERAAVQGNRSALEALDREMHRATEEEEFLMMATLMVLEQ